MEPCKRVGIDLGWRCNWSCAHCFYRFDPRLHSAEETPWVQVKAKIDKGRAGGLDHVVLVGYGEPAMASLTPRMLEYAQEQGMASSMITNGACGLYRYKSFYDRGIDHLHISSHGFDNTLRRITGMPAAFRLQTELKKWLQGQGLPFRTNMALQQLNYQEAPRMARHEIDLGVYHFVLLGFLPHYAWARDAARIREVALHPAELRPYIEQAASILEASGTLFTIRYHPFCHLSPRWWKYVVNARYVNYDPFEWNYSLQVRDKAALWRASVKLGEAVRNYEPCDKCSAYRHCGGWNRTYAAAFGGAGLRPIQIVPEEYQPVWDRDGGLHDLNPANAETGTISSCLKKQI